MEYFVQSRGEVTRRTVNPFGLVYYEDHWNLIAFDHLRQDIRNFRLDHIRKMHVLSERFELPHGFDLAEYLKERGASPHNRCIRLRFAAQAYRWARRSIPAELEEEREVDGGVEVTFYFENLDYVSRWLIRFGRQVRVLEPEELKDRILAEVRAVAEQYEPETALTK